MMPELQMLRSQCKQWWRSPIHRNLQNKTWTSAVVHQCTKSRSPNIYHLLRPSLVHGSTPPMDVSKRGLELKCRSETVLVWQPAVPPLRSHCEVILLSLHFCCCCGVLDALLLMLENSLPGFAVHICCCWRSGRPDYYEVLLLL